MFESGNFELKRKKKNSTFSLRNFQLQSKSAIYSLIKR